jgi:hypothetical protein
VRRATTVIGAMSWRRQPNGVVAIGICAGMLLAGCGEESPKPDRQDVRERIVAFFSDAANGDVEAVCGALTGVGRAYAAGRGTFMHSPPEPASTSRCIDRKAQAATGSVDLPLVIRRDLLRVKTVQISGATARAVVCNAALCRPQRLRKTADGWKIESFQLPVND